MSSSSSNSASGSEQSSSHSSHSRKRQRLSEESDNSDSNDTSDDSKSSDSDREDDAPVLSHAKQRRQKRKEKLAAKLKSEGEGDSSSKKQRTEKVKNTADLPPSKVPKRQNSIWVGNLSFKTTPVSLRAFFEGVGEITRIHMPMKMVTAGPEGKGPRKENRGFAYVDFATPDAKTVAITMSENPLDGRRLLIKDGDDFKGRPAPTVPAGADGADSATASTLTGHTKTAQKILSMQKQPPGQTLFLGNLGFETTQDSIRELFESHRAKEVTEGADVDTDKWMRKIRMGTFEDSGKCKGWAFVDFTSTEHATAALTNPRNHHLNGRKLVVEYASPDAVRRGGGGPPRGPKDKDMDTGGSQRQGPKRDRPARPQPHAYAGEAGDGELRPPAKRRRAEGDDRDHSAGRPRPRTKPGAALALAKREEVAIVPSQGKKIVF
ncbi:hypothetical protein C8Q80DRAFT_1251708 [Daedaleopsis nitida]|nr:hypothetical protein C8Q80DRAFT_1251708 [Daedaleopsis nitida]